MTRYSDHTIGDIQDDLKHKHDITGKEKGKESDVERGKMGGGNKYRTGREKEE